MASTASVLVAGVIAAASLSSSAAEVRAQVPFDLPALPELPGSIAIPMTPPALNKPASTQPATCTPGHCTHRGMFAKNRCKRRLQDLFLGFPEEFDRPPLGTLMHAANQVQVVNAQAAALVLYQYDFEPNRPGLNLRGRDKVGAIAAMLPTNFHAVIVEQSGQPTLDDQRRLVILAALNSGPFPVPSQRVVIGPAIARGMSGEEAEFIHAGMLDRTLRGGPPVGVGVTSSSTAGSR